MQRHMLRLTLVLGVLITILGNTGVFAVFIDQASGGVNSVDSGVRPSAADLDIATATEPNGAMACGTFSDDTTTAQFTIAGIQPGSGPRITPICLRNNGASSLAVRVGTSSTLRDVDTLCTGDEAAAGDLSCGDDAVGELSDVLLVTVSHVACSNVTTILSSSSGTLADMPGLLIPVGDSSVAPATTICVRLLLEYDRNATATQIQVAQSDLATWQFVFEGAAS